MAYNRDKGIVKWRQEVLVILFLIGAVMGIRITPASQKLAAESYVLSLAVKPQGTPPFIPTPTEAYRMAQGYQALDVFHYFLYQHRLVYADFPQSVHFTPYGPTSMIGFTDQTEAETPYWYIIAVFQTQAQAQSDYSSLKSATRDAMMSYNRCMIIAAHDTPSLLLQLYASYIQTVCDN